jgi:PAS domain S-box-containing protein
MGLGRPAADPTASTLTAEEGVALLEQSLPHAPELPEALAALEAVPAPLAQWPELGSQAGRRIRIACEAVFLDPAGARPWLAALHRLLGAQRYEQLMLFLAFVRMANFWTELHPELQLEGDLRRLLEEHEALAQVLLPGPQGAADGLAARVREETTALAEQQKLVEQLRLITDALHALVAYIDRDQRYIFVNAGYAGAFDLAPGMIIGRTVRDVLGDDLYGKARPHLEAALGGHGMQRYEFALEVWDGRPHQVTVVPHQRSDGSVVGCTVLVVDVTERKLAEAALRESEGSFRTLSEAAPAMVWACRPDGFVFYLNQRWIEYTGQTLEQYQGFGWAETMHPEDRPRILAHWEQCRNSGEIYEGEVRYRRHDGQYRWHFFRAVPMRDEDGTIITWYGVSLDVHGKKAAEQALSESEARFREMADNAPMMVWVSDMSGQCTFLSRSWYEFTDQTPHTGLGSRWLDAVHPEDRDRVRQSYFAAIARQEPFRQEYRLRRADGEYRWAIDAAAPRLDQDDAFLGFIGSVIDISERKEAEDRQALLMREVDHRARNALAVVQSVVRLTRADDPASFVATVEGRIGAIAYAHTLLAESGWTRASLRSLLERELAPHGFERIQLSGEGVVLGPESAQPFALAIHELVTNAVKYGALSSASGRVEVVWKLDPAAGGVRITWRETGGPPVQPPARQSFGSTLIARALEDQLGGSARQQWHPQGLVCELVIPVERLPGPASGAPSRSEPQTGAVRVLVIEDDMLIALDLAEMLRELGHQVIGPVGRLSDALEIIERESVDAAVLDANLGGESAAPIAKRLRTLAIPFVVATGYAQVPDFGAADETLVLTKPIAAQDLRGALRALLAGAVA